MVSINLEYPVPKLMLRKLKFIAQSILEQEQRVQAELSVLLTDDRTITELNQKYFKRARATDVIAFPQADSKVLGDVVISVETAEKQAIELGHHLEEELFYLFIHGILHLLGFDDTKTNLRRKMRAKERAYLMQFHIEAHPEKR
ncbi:MAG: rRNA maturation RNase YbeY [bacterium]|nr:rRNA maturation RNase YbeY [bacterium]